MQNSEINEKRNILTILQDHNQRLNSFDLVYSFIEKYDGFELTRKKAEQFVHNAIKHVQIFGTANKDVEILTGLANYVLVREK